jgi:serine phosphatase RsbU (regulator of sigma subunit)
MTGRLGKWLLGVLLGALGIAGFAFLYQGTKAVDLRRHAEASEALRRLQHLSAVEKEEALAARFNLRNHYDPLTAAADEAAETIDGLGSVIEAAVGDDADLDRAVRELAGAQRGYRQKLEQFKSRNSVLKNSLYYLPLAGEELNAKLRASSEARREEMTLAIDRLVKSTLAYNLLRSDSSRNEQAQALEGAEQLGSSLGAPLSSDAGLLLAHARTVVRAQDEVEPLLAEILGPEVEQEVRVVEDLYGDRFQQLSARADAYRKVLYGWSLLLLAGLLFAGYQLRKLYASLEEKVRERTQQLDRALGELWGEMKLAKKIQTALVPQQIELPGCDVAAVMRPADEVGGDYYDVMRVEDADWILIGDASGHGVPAGLIMMMCQTAVRTALHEDGKISPDRLLATVNRTLTENIRLLGEDKYMTMHALCRTRDGAIRFSGMHQDIFIYRAATGAIETIEPSGCFLGIQEEIEGLLDVRSFKLEPGDAMLLYTDGITEARSGRFMLDNSGLKEQFERLGSGSAQEIMDGLMGHLAGYEVTDDVAAIVLKQH